MTTEDSKQPNEPPDGPLRWTVTREWDEEKKPSTAIVEAVASMSTLEETDLPPLHHSLDVQALNDLLTGNLGASVDDVSVTFRYVDVDVTVESAGTVVIRSAVDGR